MDWTAWIHAPGMPPSRAALDTSLIELAESAHEAWVRDGSCEADHAEWISDLTVLLLENFLESMASDAGTCATFSSRTALSSSNSRTFSPHQV